MLKSMFLIRIATLQLLFAFLPCANAETKRQVVATFDLSKPGAEKCIRDPEFASIVDSPDKSGKCIKAKLLYEEPGAAVGVFIPLQLPGGAKYTVGSDLYLEFELYCEAPVDPRIYLDFCGRLPNGDYPRSHYRIDEISSKIWHKMVLNVSGYYLCSYGGKKRLTTENGHTLDSFSFYADQGRFRNIQTFCIKNMVMYKDSPLEQKAQGGDPVAQFIYGFSMGNGWGQKKDPRGAMQWLQKAANQGHHQAQFYLAYHHALGVGVPKNPKDARVWHLKAAESNDPMIIGRIAKTYLEGIGVPKDAKFGMQFLQQGADSGQAIHVLNLGWEFETGKNVPKDLAKAAVLYEKSGDLGFGLGYGCFGKLLLKGEGMPKDSERGVQLLTKGAKMNDYDCMYWLGEIYAKGDGVEKDIEKAKYWYQEAARRTHEGAVKKLKELNVTPVAPPKSPEDEEF